MSRKSQPILDQLEDALLKLTPGVGGLFGAICGSSLLGKTVPMILAVVIGGAVGAGIVGVAIMLLFRAINPRRDRSRKRR